MQRAEELLSAEDFKSLEEFPRELAKKDQQGIVEHFAAVKFIGDDYVKAIQEQMANAGKVILTKSRLEEEVKK